MDREYLSGKSFVRRCKMATHDVVELNYKSKKFCEKSFDEFYNEYYKKIYHYISLRIRSSYIAEDLTCISMEKIVKNIGRYDKSKTQLNTWIFTIAKNTLVDYYRLKSTKNVLFDADCEMDIFDIVSMDVEDCALEAERKEIIEKLLETLPERERKILVLKFWGGLKSSKIGEKMNIEEGHINIIVFRSLKKLKKYIEYKNIEL